MGKERIKKVYAKTMENGGNVTAAMRELKYKETTINQPANVTRTKTWLELVEQDLPDKALTKMHKQGLKATRREQVVIGTDSDGNPLYDFVKVPDFATRHRYLETAYKIKSKIPQGVLPQQVNQFNFFNLSEDELQREIATTITEIEAVAKGGSLPARPT